MCDRYALCMPAILVHMVYYFLRFHVHLITDYGNKACIVALDRNGPNYIMAKWGVSYQQFQLIPLSEIHIAVTLCK